MDKLSSLPLHLIEKAMWKWQRSYITPSDSQKVAKKIKRDVLKWYKDSDNG